MEVLWEGNPYEKPNIPSGGQFYIVNLSKLTFVLRLSVPLQCTLLLMRHPASCPLCTVSQPLIQQEEWVEHEALLLWSTAIPFRILQCLPVMHQGHLCTSFKVPAKKLTLNVKEWERAACSLRFHLSSSPSKRCNATHLPAPTLGAVKHSSRGSLHYFPTTRDPRKVRDSSLSSSPFLFRVGATVFPSAWFLHFYEDGTVVMGQTEW